MKIPVGITELFSMRGLHDNWNRAKRESSGKYNLAEKRSIDDSSSINGLGIKRAKGRL